MDEHKAGTTLSRRELLARGALLGVGASLAGPGLVEQAVAAVSAGTKLQVWSWQSTGGYPKVFDAVGKQFDKVDAPNKAQYKYFPYADYFTKFKTAAAGGRVPDMLEMEWSGNYHAAVDAGTLRDLTKDIQTGFPKFYATAMAQMRYKNKIFGIPMDLNTLTVAYNKDIFTKLGLTIPKTLADLLAMVPKIKAAGLQPMSLNAKDGWPNGDLWFSQLAYTDPNATLLRSAEAGKAPWDSPRVRDRRDERAEDGGGRAVLPERRLARLRGRLHRVRDRQVGDALPRRQLRHAGDRQHRQGLDQLRALPAAARRRPASRLGRPAVPRSSGRSRPRPRTPTRRSRSPACSRGRSAPRR